MELANDTTSTYGVLERQVNGRYRIQGDSSYTSYDYVQHTEYNSHRRPSRPVRLKPVTALSPQEMLDEQKERKEMYDSLVKKRRDDEYQKMVDKQNAWAKKWTKSIAR